MKDLEKFEAMHAKVEKLGEADNYNGQADAFLKGTGATIEGRFLGIQSGHFGPDDDNRDTWEIRIKRNGREFVFKFGNSIKATEDRLERLLGNSASYQPARYRKEPELIKNSMFGKVKVEKWESAAKEWHVLTSNAGGFNDFEPRPYDILAGLTNYEPEKDIDDFAAEYGYTVISEAVRVHKAVLDEWENMRALFDNDELETLGLIA